MRKLLLLLFTSSVVALSGCASDDGYYAQGYYDYPGYYDLYGDGFDDPFYYDGFMVVDSMALDSMALDSMRRLGTVVSGMAVSGTVVSGTVVSGEEDSEVAVSMAVVVAAAIANFGSCLL